MNEKMENLLFMLFNDNLTDCGKRKLKNYIENLQHQLEEKDKIIGEIEKYCNEEISKIQKHQYAIGTRRLNKILEILKRGKNANNK